MFIQDDKAYGEARNCAADIFALDSRVPDQVFLDSNRWFRFEEFLWATSKDFWPEIQRLAAQSKDETLTIGVLDPDPQGYFKENFGYYSWINVPTSIEGDEYWNLLNFHPQNSPADSMLFNSETVIWFPRSAKWAIWGERKYGICVLGCLGFVPSNAWHSLDWALKGFLPNSFASNKVPEEFQKKLHEQYAFGR